MNSARRRVALLAFAGVVGTAACGYTPEYAVREGTDDFDFRVTSIPIPPIARHPNAYKIVVRDQHTGAPVQGGDGLIFATHQQGAEAAGGLVRPPGAWDSLHEGQELGTYYATMNFIIAGDWALAIRFRRDTTDTLQRIDWVQVVNVPSDTVNLAPPAASLVTPAAPATP